MALGASPPLTEEELLAGPFDDLKLDQNPTNALSKWKEAEETITIDDNDMIFRRL